MSPLYFYLIPILSKDSLAPSSDSYDRRLSKIDASYSSPLSLNNRIALKEALLSRLDSQVSSLASFTGLDNLYPISSSSLWISIYNYIMANLPKFLKDTSFSFLLSIRHSFCLFILPLSPTDHFLVIPSFYSTLLPSSVKRHPLGSKFLTSLDRFLRQVKKKSKTEVLVTYRAIKEIRVEELSIIKEIPDLIRNNPLKIIKWLSEFKLIPV